MPELLNGKSVGTDGLLIPGGWSNSEVFRIYMKNHFLKYVQGRNPSDTILALYDGHKSHISLDLIDWAKNNNIVLFVLPPHCSHILQPLDVGCFGAFQLKYNQECLSFPVKPIKQSLALMSVLLLAKLIFLLFLNQTFNLLFRNLASIPFSLLKLCYKTLNKK